MRPIIIIGGGLTGLVCAYRLRQSRVPVLLLEAGPAPGGLIATNSRSGFIFESGPQAPRFSAPLLALIRELGFDSEFVPGDSQVPRYILKSGRLHKAPFSPGAFLATSLVGAASKYRILAEPFRRSLPPPAAEESLANFVRRKFDSDFLDYVVDPFMSALLAADVEKIGVASAFPFLDRWERAHGGLLRGALRSRKQNAAPNTNGNSPDSSRARRKSLVITDALPSLGTFRSGLAVLPDAIAKNLGDALRCNAPVEKIEPQHADENDNPSWRLTLRNGKNLGAAGLVIATPAYEAARLLRNASPSLAASLSQISYAPLAVVSSGYARSQVRHALGGFGVMIPRREKLAAIFHVWNSSIFPGRAPAAHVLLTSFAGGATNPDFPRQADDAIARAVESEMAKILGIDGPPVERFVWKHARALPQFNVGHQALVASIRESAAALPGVFLAGNYFDGRSLGECFESGANAAEEVAGWLATGPAHMKVKAAFK